MTKIVPTLPNANGLDPASYGDLDLYTTLAQMAAAIAAAGLGGYNNLALTGTLTLNGDPVAATRARRSEILRPTGAGRETIERGSAGVSDTSPLSSGRRTMAALPLYKGDSVANLSFVSGATAAVTPTHWWVELWDANRNLIAVSADQTTRAIPANTIMSTPVAINGGGSYSVLADALYYLGIVVVAATVPSLLCCTAISSTLLGQAPKLAGSSDTGLAAPPTFPTTASSISTTASWAYGFTS